ncbi:hypothetical protein SKAU_G00319680 [Synaphobranchus kaupii]|uniref:C-type lectin domain-containing protein n=1 Tax=Synaphobranchus kaupii TaxID=118154 RepID=A0A9Q1ENM2_SYNKA|nr:hypothetical protein SKAU_G00319680 [Synaphobranchus kaupii]
MSDFMDSTSLEFSHRHSRGSRMLDFGMKGARLYKLIAVCLGLLCVLLLTVITAVCIHYNGLVNNTKKTLVALQAEKDQLQTNYSSVTADKDQLQTNYSFVIAEKDQLQTNYSFVIAEKDQLQTNYSTVMRERDKLQNTLVPPCPKDWPEFKSSLYFPSTDTKTWSESRNDCQARGADLVTINNREEQVFLSGFMKTNHFWIGLSDRNKEGDWTWVDGTSLTSGFWKTGEPNDYGSNEDCATSEPQAKPDKNWNDMPCSITRNWVCEKPACQ